MQPKRAIIRPPSGAFPGCISSHPLRDTVSADKAREQHRVYCDTLKQLGLELLLLNEDEGYPDSCFVEDTAVVHNGRALIARMAKSSRQGEENTVEAILGQYLQVRRVTKPGTLEGGDVIHLPNKLITGVSQRTNIDGVFQMRDWLQVGVDAIRDPNIVHLKSHATFLGKKTMICRKAYRDHPALEKYNLIVLDEEDSYAANTLTIGDVVLMPAGFDRAADMVREAGYEVVPVPVGEFEKCEGALTCLSILF
jgi:dimethylargininase